MLAWLIPNWLKLVKPIANEMKNICLKINAAGKGKKENNYQGMKLLFQILICSLWGCVAVLQSVGEKHLINTAGTEEKFMILHQLILYFLEMKDRTLAQKSTAPLYPAIQERILKQTYLFLPHIYSDAVY